LDAASFLRSGRSRAAAFAFGAVLVIAACTSGASAPVTLPPDATASAQPASTGTPTPVPSAAFPIALVDDEGTSVELDVEPQRIVSLTPAATEILFAIGVGDRVVAKVEDITPYPPEADDLPVVATFEGVDLERIVELEADLVVAGGVNFTPPDAVEQLRRVGVPVVVVYPDTTDGALRGIELIGDAAGAGSAARALTAAMEATFGSLSALTADLPNPRVFYEIDATNKIYTPADDSVYAEMLRLAGADPILTDESYEISLEELVAADPEIIVLGDAAYGVTPDQVAARPGWGGMTAVREGAIRAVDDTLVTRPGPRLVDGLRALIAAIHPDAELP
jgi:iron complex transport system substrate-binding protein